MFARTFSARYYKDGSEILIAQTGNNPRRLTPRECARLMGFPDDFKISCQIRRLTDSLATRLPFRLQKGSPKQCVPHCASLWGVFRTWF